MKSITTFLMFVGSHAGKAEEAINLYTSLFSNSEIIGIEYHSAGGNEQEGTIMSAQFTINGISFMAMDSSHDHKFNFTPSISLYVECESETEIDKVFNTLVDKGSELMPLGNYGFSKKYGWLNDKYGVSWQLNLQD